MIADVDGASRFTDLSVEANEEIFYTTFTTQAWEKKMLLRTTESTISAPSSIETYSPTRALIMLTPPPLRYRPVFT